MARDGAIRTTLTIAPSLSSPTLYSSSWTTFIRRCGWGRREEDEAGLEDMWEDPLLASDIPLMLATKAGLYSLGLGRESSVDSPGASLRLGPGLQPQYHGEDQDQWHSNLFSAASSPSLMQSSSRSETQFSEYFQSRSVIISEAPRDPSYSPAVRARTAGTARPSS